MWSSTSIPSMGNMTIPDGEATERTSFGPLILLKVYKKRIIEIRIGAKDFRTPPFPKEASQVETQTFQSGIVITCFLAPEHHNDLHAWLRTIQFLLANSL